MSERARAAQSASETASPTDPDVSGAGGFAGMVEALRGLVTKLSEAAQDAQNAPQTEGDPTTHSFTVGGKEAKMVFGYTLRMGREGVSAEPFGDVPETPATAQPRPTAAAPARQPIVEVSEETDAIVVVAELPGADPDGITCRVESGHLHIEAAGTRRYRKEVPLLAPVVAEGLKQSFQNGILEVRLTRTPTP